jgi:hypothetical protein
MARGTDEVIEFESESGHANHKAALIGSGRKSKKTNARDLLSGFQMPSLFKR